MGEKPRVLIVDDDPAVCGMLRTFLGARGYRAITAATADEALQRFHGDHPDAVLLDIVIPGSMDGLGTLAALKKIDPDVPVIAISGQGHANTVVQAMKLGAYDFVCKPFEDHEIEMLLATTMKQRQLSREVATLREQVKEQSRYTMLFGGGEHMAEVRDLIERVADTDVTVLIRGESGTGKEIVAHALHERSVRHDKPFVKVNCAALPTELLESELFGFEKGAFTGAIQQKPGKFEHANEGTIFLDEIGDMSVPLQAKLLQVLQDGEFSRLGGKNDVQVDVRVITATNRDLETAVASGEFREDLYFRLNVVTISLPPLRERREEVPVLAEHFLKKYAVQYNKPPVEISSELSRHFMEYNWPGNVRELENMIKRMVVLGSETPILTELRQHASSVAARAAAAVAQPSLVSQVAASATYPTAAVSAGDLPAAVASAARGASETIIPAAAQCAGAQTDGAVSVSLKDVARAAAREAERELILRMLTRTRWNRKEAAEILGISYKALLYKIKENGLDKVS
jgi:two-component system, NtrC family, response regulator AtoC